MSNATALTREFPAVEKFSHPDVTADGSVRASVALDRLETLWFNTGTLCNLACTNCYIESSPKNDRLAYITAGEVQQYLTEIAEQDLPVAEIAFTGGEPFMNPEIISILDASLSAGFKTLVLTNAMRPMMKCADSILDLHARFGDRLTLRVSLDHYQPAKHDELRGERSWERTIPGLRFLTGHGITTHIAGRTCWDESTESLRAGFAVKLVLFPEMDEHADVPEITEQCWGILGMSPSDIMCATSRMVVKRRGADRPVVMPCTLLPYDREFEMGQTLESASRAVKLNHPHCAKFCVLGGGSCSVAEA